MCDKEALEPASRVFRTPIRPKREKRITCRPEHFPPNGKGRWRVRVKGLRAQQIMKRLAPLLTKIALQKWEKTKQKCR